MALALDVFFPVGMGTVMVVAASTVRGCLCGKKLHRSTGHHQRTRQGDEAVTYQLDGGESRAGHADNAAQQDGRDERQRQS